MIRTVIVDDHKILCEGVEKLLAESNYFIPLATFQNGANFLQELPSLDPDLLIVDIEIPGIDGLEIIRRVRLNNKDIKIIVLSMHDEGIFQAEAKAAGANGYLSKNIDSAVFVDLVLKVVRGETVISIPNKPLTKESPLSHQESAILKLVATGKTSEEIGDCLNISPLTVKTHRKNIFKKLGARNAAGLIKIALEQGLL